MLCGYRLCCTLLCCAVSFEVWFLNGMVWYGMVWYSMVWYIPLISRVQSPYGKLWTESFPSFYGPSAKRAGHENKEGKSEDP